MQPKPSRRTIRLPGYDYADSNAYFVTLCAYEKRCIFGEINNGVMQLNRYGHIVAEKWRRTAEVRPAVTLDEWVVMPNHFHAIVMIRQNAGLARQAPTPDTSVQKLIFAQLQSGSLGTIIGSFKAAVTRRIHAERAIRIPEASPVRVWQRNYYEHIIRDERELKFAATSPKTQRAGIATMKTRKVTTRRAWRAKPYTQARFTLSPPHQPYAKKNFSNAIAPFASMLHLFYET